MRVLFTGSGGFVGSNLVHYWNKTHPKDIIGVFDNLSYAADITNLDGAKYTFYRGDAARGVDVLNCMNDFKPDLVWLGHAFSHVDRSIEDPESFIRPNVTGIANFLSACRLRPPKHLIHQSTDEVLSHKAPYCVDDIEGLVPSPRTKSRWVFHRPSEDNCRFHPQNPYSASKLGGEALVWAYRNTYKMPITIIRATNMYGPRQYPEKLISLAITKFLNNEKMGIYGDGQYWRDYLYVDDFCRAFDLISSQPPGGDWHVSANNEKTNIEVLNLLLRIMGKDNNLLEFIPDRPGHDLSYSLDSSKLRSLGWKPQVNLNQGLTSTVDWFKLKK